ncbi:collagen alpha-1(I) chain-like [Saccopteryx bilineata]|uniref:collagen alpha-1(I) chain-like n=1 Tax=Saccopteryx bilineata TaxID=59482 RepID=UPI00338F6045
MSMEGLGQSPVRLVVTGETSPAFFILVKMRSRAHQDGTVAILGRRGSLGAATCLHLGIVGLPGTGVAAGAATVQPKPMPVMAQRTQRCVPASPSALPHIFLCHVTCRGTWRRSLGVRQPAPPSQGANSGSAAPGLPSAASEESGSQSHGAATLGGKQAALGQFELREPIDPGLVFLGVHRRATPPHAPKEPGGGGLSVQPALEMGGGVCVFVCEHVGAHPEAETLWVSQPSGEPSSNMRAEETETGASLARDRAWGPTQPGLRSSERKAATGPSPELGAKIEAEMRVPQAMPLRTGEQTAQPEEAAWETGGISDPGAVTATGPKGLSPPFEKPWCGVSESERLGSAGSPVGEAACLSPPPSPALGLLLLLLPAPPRPRLGSRPPPPLEGEKRREERGRREEQRGGGRRGSGGRRRRRRARRWRRPRRSERGAGEPAAQAAAPRPGRARAPCITRSPGIRTPLASEGLQPAGGWEGGPARADGGAPGGVRLGLRLAGGGGGRRSPSSGRAPGSAAGDEGRSWESATRRIKSPPAEQLLPGKAADKPLRTLGRPCALSAQSSKIRRRARVGPQPQRVEAAGPPRPLPSLKASRSRLEGWDAVRAASPGSRELWAGQALSPPGPRGPLGRTERISGLPREAAAQGGCEEVEGGSRSLRPRAPPAPAARADARAGSPEADVARVRGSRSAPRQALRPPSSLARGSSALLSDLLRLDLGERVLARKPWSPGAWAAGAGPRNRRECAKAVRGYAGGSGAGGSGGEFAASNPTILEKNAGRRRSHVAEPSQSLVHRLRALAGLGGGVCEMGARVTLSEPFRSRPSSRDPTCWARNVLGLRRPGRPGPEADRRLRTRRGVRQEAARAGPSEGPGRGTLSWRSCPLAGECEPAPPPGAGPGAPGMPGTWAWAAGAGLRWRKAEGGALPRTAGRGRARPPAALPAPSVSFAAGGARHILGSPGLLGGSSSRPPRPFARRSA